MGSVPHSRLSPEQKKIANQRSIASRRKRLLTDEEAKAAQRRASRKWIAKNPRKQMLYRARARAREDGVPCTIGPEDFYIPVVCPVLGIELGRDRDSAPSLDRIIPSKGYVLGNIVVMSNRANRLKCDCTTSADLRAVAEWIDKNIRG
jgi:hypothetical protein